MGQQGVRDREWHLLLSGRTRLSSTVLRSFDNSSLQFLWLPVVCTVASVRSDAPHRPRGARPDARFGRPGGTIRIDGAAETSALCSSQAETAPVWLRSAIGPLPAEGKALFRRRGDGKERRQALASVGAVAARERRRERGEEGASGSWRCGPSMPGFRGVLFISPSLWLSSME